MRFFAVAAILWIVVLVSGNDLHPYFAPGEASLLQEIIQPPTLPGLLYTGLRQLTTDLFALRLPGILLLVITFGLLFAYGRKLFGASTIYVALLVLASSLLINVAAKFALADNLLLLGLTGLFLSSIHYLKTGRGAAAVWLFGLASAWTQPVVTLVGGLSLYGLLRQFHPQGKGLDKLYLYAVLPTAAGAVWLLSGSLTGVGFSLGAFVRPVHHWLGLQALGLLPWLGFLLAALWNTGVKARKGEELSIILGSAFVASLLTGSLLPQIVLGLMIARQVNDFFRPGYPYRPIIVFGSIVQLVGFFFLAMYVMMTGFRELGGTGFRVGMALGLVYWIPGVFGLVGMWSKGPKLLIGGRVLSGLLVMLIGWLLLFPVVQQYLQ